MKERKYLTILRTGEVVWLPIPQDCLDYMKQEAQLDQEQVTA